MSLYFGGRHIGVGEVGLSVGAPGSGSVGVSSFEDERGLYKAAVASSAVGTVAGVIGGAFAGGAAGKTRASVGVGAVMGTLVGFVAGTVWGAKYSNEAKELRDGREARAEAGEAPV